MPDSRGFVLIDLLMEGVAVIGVLAMTAIATVQVTKALAGVRASRAEARYEVLRSHLEELGARQAIHYADALTYSGSEEALGLTTSPGVRLEIVASGWGWAAAATHEGLKAGTGCAVYSGHVEVPRQPVAPARAGEVACTE
jgi:Tfp pilus assembly protein PilE